MNKNVKSRIWYTPPSPSTSGYVLLLSLCTSYMLLCSFAPAWDVLVLAKGIIIQGRQPRRGEFHYMDLVQDIPGGDQCPLAHQPEMVIDTRRMVHDVRNKYMSSVLLRDTLRYARSLCRLLPLFVWVSEIAIYHGCGT